MDVVGKVIIALPEISGVAQSSGKPWKKREYVLQTQESFPRQIHFDFFGDRADQYPLQVGQDIRLYFDIESREYKGRWFTSIRGWKAEPADAAPAAAANPYAAPAAAPYGAPAPYGAAAPAPGAVPPPPAISAQEPTDDLPF